MGVGKTESFLQCQTKKYVMYMHIDGAVKGVSKYAWAYDYASVGVAVSDKATGPFNLLRTFQAIG